LQWDDLPHSLQQQLGAKPPESKLPGALIPAHPAGSAAKRAAGGAFFDPEKTWEEIEMLLIAKALIHHAFDVPRAAKALQCAPSKIYQRMREHRIQENAAQWESRAGEYRPELSLEKVKASVFADALKHFGGSPYETARRLQVSPGMVYKWTANLLPNQGR